MVLKLLLNRNKQKTDMAKHKMKSTSTSKPASINAKYEVKCRGKKITESLLSYHFQKIQKMMEQKVIQTKMAKLVWLFLQQLGNKQEQISPLYLGRKTLQNCFACVYVGKDKPQLFIGKTSKQILLDKNGLVDALKFDCLKPHIGSGSIPVLVSP